MKLKQFKYMDYVNVVIGGVLFAAAVNLFIVPMNLFSGGGIGVAQILRTLISGWISVPKGLDVAGIINFLINIPLFIMAYCSISRKFFIKTLLNVIAQTVAFTLIWIPETPIIDDVLAACLIAGLIGGFGIGFALRCGGSGGGVDILGVYMAKKSERFSVGKLSIVINACIFTCCAILFDLAIAIYSIIFTACMYLTVDKFHYQNINMTAMVFTRNPQVKNSIMEETGRGVTYWKGAGAYTDNETFVLMTVINKYEVPQVKKIILSADPQAFIIINEGMSVSGNFEKRL